MHELCSNRHMITVMFGTLHMYMYVHSQTLTVVGWGWVTHEKSGLRMKLSTLVLLVHNSVQYTCSSWSHSQNPLQGLKRGLGTRLYSSMKHG